MAKIDASMGRATALTTVMDRSCPAFSPCNVLTSSLAADTARTGWTSGSWPVCAAGARDQLLVVQDLEDDAAVDGLLLDQPRRQPVQLLAVVVQHGHRPLLGLPQQACDLLVHDPLGLLGVGPSQSVLDRPAEVLGRIGTVADRPQRRREAELPHHPDRQLGGLGQVVRGTAGAVPRTTWPR